MKKALYKFILGRYNYFLLLEPTEEMIRERREYFVQKELEYALPSGSMNHFYLIINTKHILTQINTNIQKRLLEEKSKYLSFIFAGTKNSYLPNFYKTRFAFLAKGRISKNSTTYMFTNKNITIEHTW